MMKFRSYIYIVVLFVVISISIGYASFGAELSISNIAAEIRINSDVRVTAFSFSTSSGSGISTYEQYDISSLFTDINLPNSDSSVTYKVTVTNYGNVDMGVYEFSGLPSNLTYELKDYKLQDKLCDSNGNCSLGANKTFYLTIKYADNGYNYSNTVYSLNISIDFRKFCTVIYKNISGTSYPSDVIHGGTLVVDFSDFSPSTLSIDLNGETISSSLYSYVNNVLTIENVTGDIIISQPETLLTLLKNKVLRNDSFINFGKAPSSSNGNGLYVRTGTENDSFPIYYYRGEVSDNNVLFANFCWKIVRTTDTGGIKLIYNGKPASDGSCNNTGTATQLDSTSAFNSAYNSAAYVGYMYGTTYKYSSKSISSIIPVLKRTSISSSSAYYYSDSVVYADGVYTLQNAETKTWSSDYNNLVGYYTCNSATETSCAIVNYISGTAKYYQYNVQLSDGAKIEDQIVVVSKTISDNGDGTYTLTDPVTVPKSDWGVSYSNYNNYYVCNDLISTTCNSKNYIDIARQQEISYASGAGYIYGNGVSYNNGMYVLTDTYTADVFRDDYTTLASKYHYTCFNTSGTCSTVYYLYHFPYKSTTAYYLTLTGGKNIENAKTEMFTNTTNSTIKTVIDNWYNTYMTDYTSKLENTIWCNDRTIVSGALKSPDTGGVDTETLFGAYNRNAVDYKPSLVCPNQNDSFTLSVANGGTNGYGNNMLDYPVGLLTGDEATLAGNGTNGYSRYSYLYSGQGWWTLSPNHFTTVARAYYVDPFLGSGLYVNGEYGVRPSISLIYSTQISGGDGSTTTPYIIA